MDFLLVLIELFSLRVRPTAEALRADQSINQSIFIYIRQPEYRFKIAILLQRGPVDPNFQVEGVALTRRRNNRRDRGDWSPNFSAVVAPLPSPTILLLRKLC